MLLLMETMAFAACTGKKSTIQKSAAVQTDTFKTRSGKEIVFTAIKHGSIRIPVRGLKPTTDYSTYPKADYIFVTHEHFDHCDTTAIRQLEKPTTVIITNANCAKIIGKGKVMHNGDHLQLADDIRWMPCRRTTPLQAKRNTIPKAGTTVSY